MSDNEEQVHEEEEHIEQLEERNREGTPVPFVQLANEVWSDEEEEVEPDDQDIWGGSMDTSGPDSGSESSESPLLTEDSRANSPGSPQRRTTDSDPPVFSSAMGSVVLDYLISMGYREAAEALREDTGMELPDQAEMESLDARVAIRDAIEEGRIDEAIAKIKELCPTLLDNNQEVNFYLLQQNLIEMIRRGDTQQALDYAQNELSSNSNLQPSQLEQLEKTFALLAFEKPETSPFGKLLDQKQRQVVSAEVNTSIRLYLNQPASSRLEALLKLMVWCQQQLYIENNRVDGEFTPHTVPDPLSLASALFGQSTSV